MQEIIRDGESLFKKSSRKAHVSKWDYQPVSDLKRSILPPTTTTEDGKRCAKRSKLSLLGHGEDEDSSDDEPVVLFSGSVENDFVILPAGSSNKRGSSNKAPERTRWNGLRKIDGSVNLNESLMFDEALAEAVKHRPVVKTGSSSSSSDPSSKKVSVSADELQAQMIEESNPPPPKTYLRECGNILDWDMFLQRPENLLKVPHVHFFKGAPFADIWEEIAVLGLKIELRNPFVKGKGDVYWFGTIVHYAGYRALVRFESLEEEGEVVDHSKQYVAWISFCSDVPKPLGWCGKNKKKMLAGPVVRSHIPLEAMDKGLDRFYKGAKTISEDHTQKLVRSLVSTATVDHKLPIEALDLDCLSNTRLGRVSLITGNRAHVDYEGKPARQFWFNYRSDLIHPLGWSRTVGVPLNGLPEGIFLPKLPPAFFPSYPEEKIQILKGMRLETRHPVHTYKLVGAVVVKVLEHGYFMIQTRDNKPTIRTAFIYHVTSPFVLPLGFGAKHGIEVESNFEGTTGKPLRLDLLPPRQPHYFKEGFKLEAMDIIDSIYCAPATVLKVAGHLLFLHFDKWSKSEPRNFQWVDTVVSDIYPCGYRELISIPWEGSVEDPYSKERAGGEDEDGESDSSCCSTIVSISSG